MIVGDKDEKQKKPATGPLAPVKNWWNNQPPKKQKLLMLGIAGIFILIFGMIGYNSRHHEAQPAAKLKSSVKNISLDQNTIEKTMFSRAQQSMSDQNKVIASLQKEMARITSETAATPPVPKSTAPVKQPAVKTPPPIPIPVTNNYRAPAYRVPPPPASFDNKPQKDNSEVFGGISDIENSSPTDLSKKKAGKKKFQIFLPPSFMEATLLSGVDATTTSSGKGNPVPVLLRVQNMAILPNFVKANLKGCFVLGEGIGNLATERVDIRLLTLSCVSKNGASVIDQAIKGYVVDGDGKAGLRGVVAAKMGSMLARSALAGFLGGVGNALQSSTQSSQLTAAGTQQLWSKTDTNSLIRGGIGGGISEPASQLEKFYLELARQTLPIIQVGATKIVTIVISNGVNLEVKNVSIVN